MDRTWVFVGLLGIVCSMDPRRNNCLTSVDSPVVSSVRLKVLNVPWLSPVRLDILYLRFVFYRHVALHRLSITAIPENQNVH